MKVTVILSLALLLSITHAIPTPPIFSCVDNSTITAENDCYHYNITKHSLVFPYVEWWWFEFVDYANDLAIDFAYSVKDPSNKFGEASCSISSMAWNGISNPQTAIFTKQTNFYSATQFQGTSENANVVIANKNFIKLLNDTSYHIVGETTDSEGGYVEWDFIYTQATLVNGMQETMKFDIPIVDIDLFWVSYMPQAQVSGTLDVNSTFYSVNTFGYHDHNYGSWPTKMLDWIWMQINQEDLAIVSGAMPIDWMNHGYTGYSYIRYKGQDQKISDQCGDYFLLTPLNFTTTPDGKKYGTAASLSAYNNVFMLNVTWAMKIETYNPASANLKISVMEQISQYTGSLSVANSISYKDDNGQIKESVEWVIAEKIDGFGFSEWSDKLDSMY
eukprot:TRINITY_DN315_c0_g1_i1.p1 TRINITY_DN315_c0_g1~~TRINITY_DN315_c0_g1_i1.p1  ORF type:complete len:448 (+),score=87.89 TRINITY_DN315_c0_g1_i1:183-1346(+)